MSKFSHDTITKRGFRILRELGKKLDFVLIGGWAVFLYSNALKSEDIDIIIDYDQLDKIRKEFELFKNERLKKYEIKIQGIDIDIYLPHFSDFKIPVEDIKNYTQSIEGFLVPIPEVLLILKTDTFKQRKGTTKARKDLIDIFSLIKQGNIDWKRYKELVKKYKIEKVNQELKNLISSTISVAELNLSEHQMARLRKKTLEEL